MFQRQQPSSNMIVVILNFQINPTVIQRITCVCLFVYLLVLKYDEKKKFFIRWISLTVSCVGCNCVCNMRCNYS